MAFTTFNPLDIFGGALSGGNLIYNSGGGGGSGRGARAIDGHSTGKYYFEIARTTSSFDFNDGGGITLLTSTLAQMQASQGGAWIVEYGPGSQTLIDGTIIYQNATAPQNTLMCIAVDLDGGLIWTRPNSTFFWNNSATATPQGEIGGFSLGALVGQTMYPAVVQTSANVYVSTANFGQSAFAGAVPTGFTAGWPTATPTGVQSRVINMS